jgi:hypothetical protein
MGCYEKRNLERNEEKMSGKTGRKKNSVPRGETRNLIRYMDSLRSKGYRSKKHLVKHLLKT